MARAGNRRSDEAPTVMSWSPTSCAMSHSLRSAKSSCETTKGLTLLGSRIMSTGVDPSFAQFITNVTVSVCASNGKSSSPSNSL
eukprot:5514409-Prymnesium_polylepis.2